jgi:hypothetical protein
LQPGDRSALAAIKTSLNIALAGRKRLPEHFDDLPFHFDFIDADFAGAVAFRDDAFAFIGITIPFVQGKRLVNRPCASTRDCGFRLIQA